MTNSPELFDLGTTRERESSALKPESPATDSHTAGSALGFRTDIQGLRGLAVLLVVLFHAKVPGLAGGFIGVDVFFVISGFVIGASILREVERTGTLSLGRFFGRRVRRLLPAQATMLLTTLVLVTLFLELGAVQVAATKTALAATFSVANFQLLNNQGDYFGVSEELNPFLHMWSLGVEEQFYLATPALLLLLVVISRSTRWSARLVIGVGLLMLTLASLAVSVWWTGNFEAQLAFYSPFARFWEMAAGVLLACVPSATRRLGFLAPAAIFVIVATALTYNEQTTFPGIAALLPVLATVVLLHTAPSSRLTKLVLHQRSLVWLGDRSYGWYLWHWPFVVAARQVYGASVWTSVVASVLALVPAALSYQYLERRDVAPTWRIPTSKLPYAVALTLLALVTSSSVVQLGSAQAWGIEIENTDPDGIAYESGCISSRLSGVEECVFTPAGQIAGTIVLIGDSHAASIADAVLEGAQRNGFTVVITANHSCPFIDVPADEFCEEHRSGAYERIESLRPDFVLLAHSSPGYLERSESAEPLVGNADEGFVTDRDELIDVWGAGMRTTRQRFEHSGIPLVSIDTVPTFPYEQRTQTVFSPSIRTRVLDVQALEAQREIVRVEHEALRDEFWIDPSRTLCDDTVCTSRSANGEQLYFDNNHLNRASGSVLADQFEMEFRRLMDAVGELPTE